MQVGAPPIIRNALSLRSRGGREDIPLRGISWHASATAPSLDEEVTPKRNAPQTDPASAFFAVRSELMQQVEKVKGDVDQPILGGFILPPEAVVRVNLCFARSSVPEVEVLP